MPLAMEHDTQIIVTAAIIERDGLYLIAERTARGRHPGTWEFPGGKLEPEETLEQCMAREMAEEMSVRVQVGEKFAEVEYTYSDLAVKLVAFRCSIIEGEPRDIGCEAHAWVLPEELSRYDLLPPDRQLADKLLDN